MYANFPSPNVNASLLSHQNDGSMVGFARFDSVEDHGDDENADENHRCPIEPSSCHRRVDRPERPEERPGAVENSDDVDWDSESTKREMTWRKRFRVIDPAP